MVLIRSGRHLRIHEPVHGRRQDQELPCRVQAQDGLARGILLELFASGRSVSERPAPLAGEGIEELAGHVRRTRCGAGNGWFLARHASSPPGRDAGSRLPGYRGTSSSRLPDRWSGKVVRRSATRAPRASSVVMRSAWVSLRKWLEAEGLPESGRAKRG